MKKILLPLIAVLACMVSCQKDMSVLRISAEQFNGEKVHIDGNFACWDNGDLICFNGSSKSVTVDGTSKYAEIELTSTERNQTTFSAVYPYRAFVNGQYTVEFCQEQVYELVGGKQKVVAPMAAYMDASESDELEFHNLGAMLAVAVKADNGASINVKSITVEAASGVMLNGLASVYPSGIPGLIEDGASIESGYGNNKVTLDCGNGITVSSGSTKTFYISIPKVTTSSLKITISDGPNTYVRKTGENHASFSFECNKIYNIEVKMSDATTQAAQTTTIIYDAGGEDVCDGSLWRDAGWTIVSHQPGEIVIDDVLTEIPDQAFASTGIFSVTIPEGVTTIGYGAFAYCESLTYVDLPSTLTSVGDFAFYQDYNALFEGNGIVICRSVARPTVGEDSFPIVAGPLGNLYVPDEGINNYIGSDWAQYFIISPLSELP